MTLQAISGAKQTVETILNANLRWRKPLRPMSSDLSNPAATAAMKTTPAAALAWQANGRGRTAEELTRSGGTTQLSRRDRDCRRPKGAQPTALECEHENTSQSWLKAGDIDESDEALRVRVQQRIQQRLAELHAAAGPTTAMFVMRELEETLTPDAEHREIESLHEDVVLTAAQILERYLEKNQRADSLELTLVHRMLVKEVELQALSRQRGTHKNK